MPDDPAAGSERDALLGFGSDHNAFGNWRIDFDIGFPFYNEIGTGTPLLSDSLIT